MQKFFASYWPTAIVLMVVGWGGMLSTIFYFMPNGGTRWLFFFTLLLAVTGTVLPLVAYLNRRFPGEPPAGRLVILRQALWFGIYASSLAWLQLGRMLTPVIAMLILVGLMIIELLLRLRERSQWKPKLSSPES